MEKKKKAIATAIACLTLSTQAFALEGFSTDRPGAVTAVPFNFTDDVFAGISSEDRIGFVQITNLSDSEWVMAHVGRFGATSSSDACFEIFNDFICLSPRASRVLDMTQEDTQKLQGMVITHAYKSSQDECRDGHFPAGFNEGTAVFVDDSIVSQFTRGSLTTSAACASSGVQFGLGENGLPALPEEFTIGAAVAIFNPHTLDPGSEIFAMNLESGTGESFGSEIGPLSPGAKVCGNSVFYEADESRWSIGQFELACARAFPIAASVIDLICEADPNPNVCRRALSSRVDSSGHFSVNNLTVARQGEACPGNESLGGGKTFSFFWAFQSVSSFGGCTPPIGRFSSTPSQPIDPDECTCEPRPIVGGICAEDESTICTPNPQPTGTPFPTATPEPTPTATPSPAPTATPEATETPEPTPAATSTPVPSPTPAPTATQTPEPSSSPDFLGP